MNAAILTVGDELLMGKTLNTNANYFSKKLNELGITCSSQIACNDIEEDILNMLEILLEGNDMVFLSGGLGITQDDITKNTVAKFANLDLEVNEEAKRLVESYYEKIGVEVCGSLEDFALLPRDCHPLKNYSGAAMGFVIFLKKKMIAVFPGPPNELVPMFEKSFMPFFEDYLPQSKLSTRMFKIFGLRELEVIERIKDIIEDYEGKIVFSTYCALKEITLVLRCEGKIRGDELDEVILLITERFGKNLYAFSDIELEKSLFDVLNSKKAKIAVAESVSGGMISSKMVSVPGISSVFIEGLTTYTNQSKISRLGVSVDTLENFGAVSEKTAIEMCEGLLENPLVDYAIATTGLAGPSADAFNHEVGDAFIAVGNKSDIKVYSHHFTGSREMIRESVAKFGIFYLLNYVKFNEFIF